MNAFIDLPSIDSILFGWGQNVTNSTSTFAVMGGMFSELFPVLLFIGGCILGPLFALSLGRGLWNGIKGVMTKRKGGRR